MEQDTNPENPSGSENQIKLDIPTLPGAPDNYATGRRVSPKVIGTLVVVLVVVVAAAYILLARSPTVPPSNTTTSNLPVIDSYNGLYGVPGAGSISTIVYGQYPGINNSTLAVYGANFTAQFIQSANATVLQVPASYSNYTAPFLLLEISAQGASQSATLSAYNTELQTILAPGSFANSTGLNFSSSSLQLGEQAMEYSSDPYGVQLYGITFMDKGYAVQINTYGTPGKFSNSYALGIARHIDSIIQASG